MPSQSTRGRRRYCRCLQSPHFPNTIAPRNIPHLQTKVRTHNGSWIGVIDSAAQMSQSYTKLSSPPNSILMSTPNPSALSSPRTRKHSPRMVWIQPMIRSICASYLGWEMEENRGSHCTTDSRRCLRSLDSRSSSYQTKRTYRMLRQMLLKNFEFAMMTMCSFQGPSNPRDDRGELLSLQCTMPRTKLPDQPTRARSLCHGWKQLSRPCWKIDRRRELPRERRKRSFRMLRAREWQKLRLGGVG